MHPPLCHKDLKLHHFTVTAAKGALKFHVPHQFLLDDGNKVKYRISTCWPLYHLEKEATINTFQEPPGLLMSYCVVSTTYTGEGEVPHKDQGLRTRGCSCPCRSPHLLHLPGWMACSRSPTIMSPVPAHPLTLTHKLLVSSSSVPRQSSMHSSWSLTYTVTCPLYLLCLSFLRCLYSSIPALWSWEPSHISMVPIKSWPCTCVRSLTLLVLSHTESLPSSYLIRSEAGRFQSSQLPSEKSPRSNTVCATKGTVLSLTQQKSFHFFPCISLLKKTS